MRVWFNYADGLKTRDGGPVKGFVIAGADGNFVPANAKIEGSTVIVSSRSGHESSGRSVCVGLQSGCEPRQTELDFPHPFPVRRSRRSYRQVSFAKGEQP